MIFRGKPIGHSNIARIHCCKTNEKRQGKLTIARALDSDNVRVRSLASIKRRREKARMQADNNPAVKQFREVIIPDRITVSELANRMTERTADVIKELMKNGVMATANEVIDTETAEATPLAGK